MAQNSTSTPPKPTTTATTMPVTVTTTTTVHPHVALDHSEQQKHQPRYAKASTALNEANGDGADFGTTKHHPTLSDRGDVHTRGSKKNFRGSRGRGGRSRNGDGRGENTSTAMHDASAVNFMESAKMVDAVKAIVVPVPSAPPVSTPHAGHHQTKEQPSLPVSNSSSGTTRTEDFRMNPASNSTSKLLLDNVTVQSGSEQFNKGNGGVVLVSPSYHPNSTQQLPSQNGQHHANRSDKIPLNSRAATIQSKPQAYSKKQHLPKSSPASSNIVASPDSATVQPRPAHYSQRSVFAAPSPPNMSTSTPIFTPISNQQFSQPPTPASIATTSSEPLTHTHPPSPRQQQFSNFQYTHAPIGRPSSSHSTPHLAATQMMLNSAATLPSPTNAINANNFAQSEFDVIVVELNLSLDALYRFPVYLKMSAFRQVEKFFESQTQDFNYKYKIYGDALVSYVVEWQNKFIQ